MAIKIVIGLNNNISPHSPQLARSLLLILGNKSKDSGFYETTIFSIMLSDLFMLT